ncbi:unnamed protein product [Tenebrio molitor]|nr:unnamed protein product [Tenebrio molitor]
MDGLRSSKKEVNTNLKHQVIFSFLHEWTSVITNEGKPFSQTASQNL